MIMVATSTIPHHNRLSSYDHRMLPFVNVKVEGCNEHENNIKDEEGMEDNR